MKLFSILNKPAVKTDNKQAGLVFLEYVIMAFIVTVAVICALWWFYWHLQQMTWEVKQKLDTLKTLTCELGKPGGSESVQPTQWGFPYEITEYDPYQYQGDPWLYKYIPIEIPYPNQTVTITNTDPLEKDFEGFVHFYAEGKSFPDDNWESSSLYLTVPYGESTSVSYIHPNPGPYHIGIDPYGPQPFTLVSVNVTATP